MSSADTKEISTWLAKLRPDERALFWKECRRVYRLLSDGTRDAIQSPAPRLRRNQPVPPLTRSQAAYSDIVSISVHTLMGEQARRFWTLHIDTPETDVARLRLCWQLIQPDADIRPGWLKLVVKRRRAYPWAVGLLAVFLVAGTFAVTELLPVPERIHPPLPTPRPSLAVPQAMRPYAQPLALPQSPVRLFIHHHGQPNLAGRVANLLQPSHRVVDIRVSRGSVGSNQVRYYFDQDRRLAAMVTHQLQQILQEPVVLRDFTFYEPKPTRGNVEVWLADQNNSD